MNNRVGLTTASLGIAAKPVYIEAINAKYAECRDNAGHYHHIPLSVHRGKSLAPAVGETWMITNDLGRWTFGAIVGYTPLSGVRETISLTTVSLAASASEQTTLALPAAYRLYTITTSRPARVRLYDIAAHQAADLSRTTSTAPGLGAGVMLDYVTTGGLLSATLSPLVEGVDLSAHPDGEVPITVQNRDSITASVTVTLMYLRTE